MGQLLRPGYVLTLDMVFAPHSVTRFDFTETIYGLSSYDIYIPTWLPVIGLLKVLSYAVPMWLLEKIVIFFMFFLTGIAAHKFVPVKKEVARYFAGLLYMINPFVYIRFLVGHWFLLIAYAVMPLAIITFLHLLDAPKRANIIKLVLWATVIAILSLHILLLMLLVFLVILIFQLLQKNDIKYCWRVLPPVGITALILVIINLYWILPVLTAETTLYQSIGIEDLKIFSANDPLYGVSRSIVSLHGFWRQGYPYAWGTIPCWYLLIGVIIFLGLVGYIFNYRKKGISFLVNSVALAAIIGFVLGTGINGPFGTVNEWLFQHIPLLKVFRDTQKFVALLVLAYVYLGALGIDQLFGALPRETLKKPIAVSLLALVLIVPIVYSHRLFNGGSAWLVPVDYPEDWYAMERYLNDDGDDFNVLSLPWHLKMDFSWLRNQDKRLTNATAAFFTKPIIHGENIEVGSIYTQSQDPVQQYVSFLLQNRGEIKNFGELLIPLNVKYILLTKEADYNRYSFLFQQDDLEVVKETAHLILLKNQHQVARIYEVDSVTYIHDWEELLALSQQEDISQRLYVIDGQGERTPGSSHYHAISYTPKNPACYILDEQPTGNYLVLAESYARQWSYGNNPRLQAYGVTNAFEIEDTATQALKYRRFYTTYLPAYCISLATLALLMVGALYHPLFSKSGTRHNRPTFT